MFRPPWTTPCAPVSPARTATLLVCGLVLVLLVLLKQPWGGPPHWCQGGWIGVAQVHVAAQVMAEEMTEEFMGDGEVPSLPPQPTVGWFAGIPSAHTYHPSTPASQLIEVSQLLPHTGGGLQLPGAEAGGGDAMISLDASSEGEMPSLIDASSEDEMPALVVDAASSEDEMPTLFTGEGGTDDDMLALVDVSESSGDEHPFASANALTPPQGNGWGADTPGLGQPMPGLHDPGLQQLLALVQQLEMPDGDASLITHEERVRLESSAAATGKTLASARGSVALVTARLFSALAQVGEQVGGLPSELTAAIAEMALASEPELALSPVSHLMCHCERPPVPRRFRWGGWHAAHEASRSQVHGRAATAATHIICSECGGTTFMRLRPQLPQRSGGTWPLREASLGASFGWRQCRHFRRLRAGTRVVRDTRCAPACLAVPRHCTA